MIGCLTLAFALVLSPCAVQAKFFPFGDGACPLGEDDNGTVVADADNRDKCLTDCLTEKTVQPCVAFEFDSAANLCIVFVELGNLTENSTNVSEVNVEVNNTIQCENKEFVPFFESKMPLIVLMVQGVFLLHLAYFFKTCAGQLSKFRTNQDRQRKKHLAATCASF